MVVYIFEDGCPLCGGEVRGNEEYRYFCKKCNMLFNRNVLAKKRKKAVPKKEEEQITKELEATQTSGSPAEIYDEETQPIEEELKFIASSKSNKMHIDTCHFLKKIQKENWIYLDSLEDGLKKKYEPCVCIRRKGLMKL